MEWSQVKFHTSDWKTVEGMGSDDIRGPSSSDSERGSKACHCGSNCFAGEAIGLEEASQQARKKYVSSSAELTRGNFTEILVLGGNFCGKITVFSEPGNA